MSDDLATRFRQFLSALVHCDAKTIAALGSTYVEAKTALVEQTGTLGGFTVPEEFLPRLLRASEFSIIRPRAAVVRMRSDTAHVPIPNLRTALASATTTARYGGLVPVWTEETSLQNAETTLRELILKAHDLGGLCRATQAFYDDIADAGSDVLLFDLFAEAIAWHQDYAFLRGTGAGQPLGILNSGALISVTRSGANAFTLVDAAAMVARLLPGWSPQTTAWACHPTVAAKIWTLAATATNVVQVIRGRFGPITTFLGLPVFITEKLPTLNTLGDVLLIDCSKYLIGDRQKLAIAWSPHTDFINRRGTWRFLSRVDGRPWLDAAVTLTDGTTTTSPFVALAAG